MQDGNSSKSRRRRANRAPGLLASFGGGHRALNAITDGSNGNNAWIGPPSVLAETFSAYGDGNRGLPGDQNSTLEACSSK